MRRFLFISVLQLLCLPVAGSCLDAERGEIAELKEQLQLLSRSVHSLTATVEKQQQVIEMLRASHTAPVSADSQEPARVDALKAPAANQVSALPAPAGSRSAQFNPDIGIVGDIVGTLSESSDDEGGNDRISLREVELVLGHDIDPYSRFDATITFSDQEDPDVEEAYVSLWDLPAGFRGKLGRFRPRVGIAASQHRDSLDTVDEPFVVQELFGEEGYFRTGAEISSFLPFPWGSPTSEFSLGLLEGGVGHEGTLLGETERRPTLYGRVRNSFDLSDDTLVNIGGSTLFGSADESSGFNVRAFGIDATAVHNFNAINRLKFQSEMYLQDRSAPALESTHSHDAEEEEEHEQHEEELHEDGEHQESFRTNPVGFYSLLDYRLAERWSVGTRFDYSEPVNLEAEMRNHETGYTGYLTFHQSEFARWRFQYQFADLTSGEDDHRFFLQTTVAIGKHQHQLQ